MFRGWLLINIPKHNKLKEAKVADNKKILIDFGEVDTSKILIEEITKEYTKLEKTDEEIASLRIKATKAGERQYILKSDSEEYHFNTLELRQFCYEHAIWQEKLSKLSKNNIPYHGWILTMLPKVTKRSQQEKLKLQKKFNIQKSNESFDFTKEELLKFCNERNFSYEHMRKLYKLGRDYKGWILTRLER